ncbi:YihY/virulence factor BrkB family protein [Massilia horti]|uniref:YihY/virulence factor BrkB family protein n=1 Tax=Massilia horti TaxID=2562153 RepID=A0A4Y9TB68_9BURK|nr:YihY/virulence factor BrkB family protein [Massilia horti]TFW36040.1 YihY/virulence factor BrkB family protein [Massilia horti]
MHATGRIPTPKQFYEVLKAALEDWIEHRAASKGAALAYYTLFSLAPILVLVIAIAGIFYGADAAEGKLLDELRGLMGDQGAQAIQLVLAGARDKEGGKSATVVASVLLIFGATRVFAELKESLDDIWDLPPNKGAAWLDTVRTRLMSFGLVLVLSFLLIVSLVVSTALNVLQEFFTGLWQETAVLLSWLASGISFLVIATLFGVIYKLLPRARLSWRDVSIGALGTAALFTLGKFAIGLYLGKSSVASSYGAAGSLIALLLWVYYSAQIFFLGAEFTHQYALRLGSLRDKGSDAAGSNTA